MIHPLDSHYLATAASDPYLRIYDRRYLSVGARSADRSITDGLVRSLAPAHLVQGWAGEDDAFDFDSHARDEGQAFGPAVPASMASGPRQHASPFVGARRGPRAEKLHATYCWYDFLICFLFISFKKLFARA